MVNGDPEKANQKLSRQSSKRIKRDLISPLFRKDLIQEIVAKSKKAKYDRQQTKDEMVGIH